jgi:hypothetical protein
MHNLGSAARSRHAGGPAVPSAADGRTRGAVAVALDRASFDHLRLRPSLYGVEAIRAAIERADYDGAAIRALARCWLELELAPALVADVLVGVEWLDVFLALARRCPVDVLIELWRQGRIADDPVGAEQTLCIALARWQEPTRQARATVVPLLRHVARQSRLSAPGAAGLQAAALQ